MVHTSVQRLVHFGTLIRPNVPGNSERATSKFFNKWLRINDRYHNSRRNVHAIDTKQKTTFKFLSDTIPNPRAMFLIRGKRYLCEKVTATFTENGMSQLIKGIFWPIAED